MPATAVCADLDNTAPIDESDPVIADMLDKLQGNILKGHGRDHSIHLFFRFGNDGSAVRRGLRDLAATYVTSARLQLRHVDDYNAFEIPGPLFGNLFLSASGYRALEIDPPVPVGDTLMVDEQSRFDEPMHRHAVEDFGDPEPRDWEFGYREPIDAMLLLADDDPGYLMREARNAIDAIRRHSCIVHAERGQAIRNGRGDAIEHFGYVDGRSQPLYLARDIRRSPSGGLSDNRGHPVRVWDPFEPLSRILAPDVAGANCFGSFLVFRKLEQNVREFVREERELARRLFGSATPENQDRAGALVIGRFRDGTPVVLSAACGHQPDQANDFLHSWTARGIPVGDADGLCCPLQAHTRKVNPRGETRKPDERTHRITRRGITYGDRTCDVHTENLNDLPTAGVGLLFQCFQASIRRQFAFIQRQWCNDPHFPASRTGVDPLIGASRGVMVDHRWSSKHSCDKDTQHRFRTFVHMKGGEFFFAPSLPFFAGLA